LSQFLLLHTFIREVWFLLLLSFLGGRWRTLGGPSPDHDFFCVTRQARQARFGRTPLFPRRDGLSFSSFTKVEGLVIPEEPPKRSLFPKDKIKMLRRETQKNTFPLRCLSSAEVRRRKRQKRGDCAFLPFLQFNSEDPPFTSLRNGRKRVNVPPPSFPLLIMR